MSTTPSSNAPTLLGNPGTQIAFSIDFDGQTQKIRLAESKITLGCDPSCTVHIPGEGHPVHVLILRGQQIACRRWAPNTWLNGQNFTDAILSVGDEISFGGATIRFLGDEAEQSDSSNDLQARLEQMESERERLEAELAALRESSLSAALGATTNEGHEASGFAAGDTVTTAGVVETDSDAETDGELYSPSVSENGDDDSLGSVDDFFPPEEIASDQNAEPAADETYFGFDEQKQVAAPVADDASFADNQFEPLAATEAGTESADAECWEAISGHEQVSESFGESFAPVAEEPLDSFASKELSGYDSHGEDAFDESAAHFPISEQADNDGQSTAYDDAAFGLPAYAAPTNAAPAFEAPAFEAPTNETPAFEEESSYETPAFEPPTNETPAFEQESSYETPAFEPPTQDSPAYDAPTQETPAYGTLAHEESEFQAPAFEDSSEPLLGLSEQAESASEYEGSAYFPVEESTQSETTESAEFAETLGSELSYGESSVEEPGTPEDTLTYAETTDEASEDDWSQTFEGEGESQWSDSVQNESPQTDWADQPHPSGADETFESANQDDGWESEPQVATDWADDPGSELMTPEWEPKSSDRIGPRDYQLSEASLDDPFDALQNNLEQAAGLAETDDGLDQDNAFFEGEENMSNDTSFGVSDESADTEDYKPISEEELAFIEPEEASPVDAAAILSKFGHDTTELKEEAPAFVEPEPAPAAEQNDEDSSIQDYMQQLLARSGGAASIEAAEVAATEAAATKNAAVEKVKKTKEKLEPLTSLPPVKKRTERATDLAAMRALANDATRIAINRHEKKSKSKFATMKILSAVAMLLGSGILIQFSGFETNMFLLGGLLLAGLALVTGLQGVSSGVMSSLIKPSKKAPKKRRRRS